VTAPSVITPASKTARKRASTATAWRLTSKWRGIPPKRSTTTPASCWAITAAWACTAGASTSTSGRTSPAGRGETHGDDFCFADRRGGDAGGGTDRQRQEPGRHGSEDRGADPRGTRPQQLRPAGAGAG